MNRAATSGRVVLLKTPRTDDPYLEAFRGAGYRPVAVPVLRYVFDAEKELRARLASPGAGGGLIATSPRAVTALRRAAEGSGEGLDAWRGVPFFTAGPETARRARELGFAPIGEDAGGAGELADRIVRALRSDRTRRDRDADSAGGGTDRGPGANRNAGRAGAGPLLFLAGNRRRPELPDRLRKAGISFEELTVYRSELRRSIAWPEGPIAWTVFFSPSGWEAVAASGGLPDRAVRIAAIGPTTAGALRTAGLREDAVAARPEPGALVRAVRRAEPAEQ